MRQTVDGCLPSVVNGWRSWVIFDMQHSVHRALDKFMYKYEGGKFFKETEVLSW